MTQDHGDKREYFRATGVIYLHVEKKRDVQEDENHTPKSQLDLVALKLINFRSQLEYDNPKNGEYFEGLADILEQLHDVVFDRTGQIANALQSHRQSVVISGSGIEFISSENYLPGETLVLSMTFTGYPFESMTVEGQVVNVGIYGSEPNRHRICISFKNISEPDRQLIIKHVNYLQRKHLAEERKT